MQPSHQHRLPVSKPSHGYRKRRNEQLLAPGDADASTDQTEPTLPTPEAGSVLPHQPTTSIDAESRVSDLQHSYGPSEVEVDSNGNQSFETEPVIRIEVQQPEQRPFELGDLLTREFISRNNSFLVSFGLHTLMVLILSFFLIHGTGKAMIMLELLSSPDIEQETGIVAEIDVDFDESDQLLDAVSDDLFDNAFGDANTNGEKVTADGTGAVIDGDSQSGQGDGKSAKFFGMRAIGNRFVYVLDRSGSMGNQTKGPNDRFQRFDVARSELMNSVQSLRPHQEFYVVLFSTSLRRMFDDNSLLSKPIKATPENKSRLRNWLSSVRADGGTDPRKSLTLAFKMKPDAIFMLSDGEFRDENSGGQPKSIEIAKKYLAENPPIQINSIALEDQSSKVNMQELADVSGGQFRFVKVNDFLGEILLSTDQSPRLHALQQVAKSGLDTWAQKHEFAMKELIPMLNDGDPQAREKAEEILHQLSFGVFKTTIPSVPVTGGINQRKQAMASWTQVWETANELQSPDLSNDLGFFTAMASGTEDGFLKKLESIDAISLPPTIQLALVRRILDYQESHGITQQTRQILLDLFTELNKESTAKFGREHFLKNASQATCRARLKKVLSNRRVFARRLYRKWEEKKQTQELRLGFAKKIIELYPETRYAEMMRANL